MAPQPSEARVARKPRRTAIACEQCRDRKRKCDGVKPVCGACKGRSLRGCIWKQDRNSRGWWSNSYVQELKNRIIELEDSQRIINDTPVSPSGRESCGPTTLAPSAHTSSNPSSNAQQVNDEDYQHTAGKETSPINNRSAPICGDEEPDRERMLEAHGLATCPSLSSTLAVPADGIIDQASATWSNLSFTPPLRFISPLQDATQEEETSPAVVESATGQLEMDAMGVIVFAHGAFPSRKRRPSDFCGPSSTISLLREARSVMGRRTCGYIPSLFPNPETCTKRDESVSNLATASSLPPSPTSPSHRYNNSCHISRMCVPLRLKADRLIDLFRTNVHSLYPFLHWPSFHHLYLALWTPHVSATSATPANGYYSKIDESLFHCMLNIVFALGVLHDFDISHQERDDTSFTFFKRAKGLLDLDSLDSGSVPLVQVLLLMGQYLQTRDITSSCWNIIGIAIRVAQGIGLHCEPKELRQDHSEDNQATDQLEEEMRRRSWTGCVLLDRILSLTYGRPLMIHGGCLNNMRSLPSPIDDEFLTSLPELPGFQPADTPSLIECYLHAVKLQSILGQVLATSYYQYSWNDTSESSWSNLQADRGVAGSLHCKMRNSALQNLLDVDDQLDKWKKDLPAHLQVHNYSDETLAMDNGPQSERLAVFHRQATVLKARFLYVRMMLFRPSLSELCSLEHKPVPVSGRLNSIETNMRWSMLIETGNICVSVAQELISLIVESFPSHAHLLPPPWYNVLYIHGCSLVIFLSSLCLPKFGTVDRHCLMTDWNRCLSFLRNYRSQSRSASRCIRILELLEQESLNYDDGRSIDDQGLLSTIQYQSEVVTRHMRLDPVTELVTGSEKLPANSGLGHSGLDKLDGNWIDNANMNWFSLAPFFEGAADITLADSHMDQLLSAPDLNLPSP